MNTLLKNTIYIVNQSDYENIFASLNLERVSKLTICFKKIKAKKIIIGRKNSILEYLLKNINLESIYSLQAKSKPKITSWSNIKDNKYGTNGIFKEESYIRNYNNILEKQRGHITHQRFILTHNSWREFGHLKHSQFFKFFFDILKKNKKK